MWNAICNLRRNGFRPETIIDVGAHLGQRTVLSELEERLHGRATYHEALVGGEFARRVPFFLMGSGSSVLPEKTPFLRTRIELDMTTLDHLLPIERVEPPVLLKLDVQGYEVEVLRGSKALLNKVEVIVSEVSLLEYNAGSPLFADVIMWMKAEHFVAFDICGGLRRHSDSALF